MTDMIDAGELRRRIEAQRAITVAAVCHIIDAMPPAACETCKRLHMCGVLAAAYESFTDIHEVENDFACNRHEQGAKP